MLVVDGDFRAALLLHQEILRLPCLRAVFEHKNGPPFIHQKSVEKIKRHAKWTEAINHSFNQSIIQSTHRTINQLNQSTSSSKQNLAESSFYLCDSICILNKALCHSIVVFSSSSLLGFPLIVANIMSDLPFFVILRMASGSILPMLDRSICGPLRRCSGSSSSGRGSSSFYAMRNEEFVK